MSLQREPESVWMKGRRLHMLNTQECAIVREALMERDMTKKELAYYIGEMNPMSVASHHPEIFKKAELQEKFEKYLDDDSHIQKLAQHTSVQLILFKHKYAA